MVSYFHSRYSDEATSIPVICLKPRDMSYAFNFLAIIIRCIQFILSIIVLAMAATIEANYQRHGFSFSYADLALATSVVSITMAIVVPIMMWSDWESILVASVGLFLDFCTLALWIATLVTMSIFYGAHSCDDSQITLYGQLPLNLCRIGRLVIGLSAAQLAFAIVACCMGIITVIMVARAKSYKGEKVDGDTTLETI